MLKDDLEAPYVSPHALYQHNLGGLKIALAEATYFIQASQIADWDLAIRNMDPPNDGQGVHEITHPLGSK